MLNVNKKLAAILAVVLLMITALPITSFAASKTSIAFSSSSVKVGDSVSVTIKITSDHNIEWSEASIKYDSSVLKLTSAAADDYNGGSGYIKMIPETGTRTFTFKALKAGNCTFEVYDITISSDGSEYSATGSSATLKVKDVTASSNANLKYLYISAGSLSPSFKASVTEYNVSIDSNVSELLITADTEDSDAKMSVGGSKTMKVGKNTRTVTVTAPNGTSKVYTLNITKKEAPIEQTSSVDSTSSEITQQVDDIVIDGKVYNVKNAPAGITVPVGYETGSVQYNSNTYTAYKSASSDTTLFYLFSEEDQTGSLFIYESSTGSFEPLSFINSVVGSYIIMQPSSDTQIPEGFHETTRVISGNDTVVYATSSDAEYCLFYAKGPSGVTGFYVYDTVENTVQRYFGNLGTVSTEETEDENLVSMILNNPSYRMIAVAGLCSVLLVLLGLIVILIIKLHREKLEDALDEQEEDDDSILFVK